MINNEKVQKVTENLIQDIENIQNETFENHKAILEFNNTYRDIKDLMFVVIPVHIDWSYFDFESEEQKHVVIEKFCQDMISEPITTTGAVLDDYGQSMVQDRVIGVITRMEEKDDGEFRAFGVIWTKSDFELSINDKFITPHGIHIDIDADLNKQYGHYMKKQKEISQKVYDTICRILNIDDLEKNKDRLKELGLFEDEELPKPEFEKYLEEQEKEEDNE